MSGLMVLPSNVVAQEGQPDLTVKKIGWRFPAVDGEDLPVTIYIENIGDASVQTGFWLEFNYATLSGFWQEATETLQIWVEPPIGAGEIKGIEFTTTALNTHQVNFGATIDTSDVIAEFDEENNHWQGCSIAVEAIPGSSITVPIYLRNERIDIVETFTVEVDEASIPDGWGFVGGLPPTTVTAAPGGNVVLSEGAIVPADTTSNPTIRINARRQSDGASQFIAIRVLTTPEIGFSFNPYTEEVFVTGIDDIESEVSVTSEIISERGHVTLAKYTVTNTRGQYTSALVRMISTRNHNMFEIREIDYNGVVTITPEKNMFVTTYLVKNGELKHFHQYMKYGDPDVQLRTFYNAKDDQTTMVGEIVGEDIRATFDGFDGLGMRILNEKVFPIRLDTSDTAQPLCPNVVCVYCAIGLGLT